ncbi:MAG: hypothetical protein E7666_07770 [Ruminococcaceae bacterium]|nr:hypothetical protein [Oscillospiraceae bacterium]
MKRFSKILAMVLALITVLMALPLSVFADAWLDVDVDNRPEGSTLTVTLDGKALAELLKEEGVSKDLISQVLANATLDKEELLKVFTVEELFQIFPKKDILELLDLKGIIAQIGVEKLSTYIDLPALLSGCDKKALADLLADVPDLHKYVEVEELIKGDYIPDGVILDNAKDKELEAAISTINPADIIPEILNLPFSTLETLIRAYDMVLGENRVIEPEDVLNMDVAEARAKALLEDPDFNVEDYLDYVKGEEAKAYFKAKYSGHDMHELEDLLFIRDLIVGHYLDVTFEYDIHDVDLIALLDAGLENPVELEALAHDYLIEKFEAMTHEKLLALAMSGCFHYDGGDITNIDIHAVLEQDGLVSFSELLNECDGLKEHLDAEIDAWIHDNAIFDMLLEMDCVDVSVSHYTVSNIQYREIIRDEFVNVSELINNNLIRLDDLATELVKNDKMTVDKELVDAEKLETELNKLPSDVLFSYVNKKETLDYFGAEKVIEWLGGYEKAMECIDIPGVTSDILEGNMLPTIFDKMAANGVAVTDVFHLDDLLSELDFAQVIEVVGAENIFAQLDNSEIRELLKLIDVKGKAKSLLMLVYEHGMQNIDKLAINDIVIAKEDDTTLLQFDAGAMVSVVKDMIPTLQELANLESDKLASMKFTMDYMPIGSDETVTKTIIVEFVVNGTAQYIRAAASKLLALISKYVNEFTISADRIAIDINAPALFGKAYAKLLDIDSLPDSLKLKIMKMTDLDGNEMVAFINEKLTFEEIITILEAIEPSAVFESAKNHAFVEACLAKVGKVAPNVTLDEVWDKMANGEYSFENVSRVIESLTHRDVLSVLQNAATKVDGFADRAEEISVINKLLSVVESKLGIDVSEISVEEILNRGADVDLLDKIASVVASRVGVNVRAFLQNHNPDDLWAAAVEKAAEREDIYNKVRNYLLAGFDKLPDAVMGLSIVDLYDANGVFAADKTVSFQAKPMVEKALNKVLARINLDNDLVDTATDMILSRVTDGTVRTELFFAIRFSNIFKLTYKSYDGSKTLFTALVPVGARLDIFKNNPVITGHKFIGWTDANGNEVAAMPKHDLTLYATYEGLQPGPGPDDPDVPEKETVTLTFINADGTEIGKFSILKGTSFADAANLQKLLAMNATAMTFAPAVTEDELQTFGGYRVVWNYPGNGILDYDKGIGLNATFNADTTLQCNWNKEYFLTFRDSSVKYDVVFKDGVYTVLVYGEFANKYALNLKDLLAKAEADDRVTLVIKLVEDDFNLAVVKNATLKSLYNKTAESDPKYVWFEFKENEKVTAAFDQTWYKGAELPCYSIFFATSNTKSGSIKQDVDFGGATVDVQLPYAAADANSIYTSRVYTVNQKSAREYVDTLVARNGLIEFHAKHFSDFIISDEYRVTLTFNPEIDGELLGNYADQNGDLFFPVGAEFDLNIKVEDGYQIDKILIDGKEYNLGDTFTMPAKNVTISVLASIPQEPTVTLTFVDESGKLIGTITIKKGTSFLDKANKAKLEAMNATALDFAPALSADDLKAFGGYHVAWNYNNGEILDLDREIGLDATFEEDTTLVCNWEKKFHMAFRDPSVEYDVSYKDGVYTVTVYGTFADAYALNIKPLLADANADSRVKLVIKIADGDFNLATIKNATLKSLYNATKSSTDECVWFEYKKNSGATSAFDSTIYKGANVPCVAFFFATSKTLMTPEVELAVGFGGETIDIQLPYANAIANSVYTSRVYTVDQNGAREYMNTVVVKNGLIEFHAEHFSDFIISDEYRVSLKFEPVVDGYLDKKYADKNGDVFFPANATFDLKIYVQYGYVINKIVDGDGVEYAANATYTMPAKNVTFTVSVHCREYHVYYYYYDAATGKLMEAAPTYTYRIDTLDKTQLNPAFSDEAKAAVPAGYDKNSIAWTSFDETLLGVSDIAVFVTWKPISYTIKFVNAEDGNVISAITGITAENFATKYALPEAPKGTIGAWTVVSVEKPSSLTDASMNTVTIVLSGKFEKATFPVTHGAYVTDETPSFAYAGEVVTVKVEDRFGYTAQITVKNDAGEVIEVTNGTFVMPASAVNVNVTYTAKTFTYTINKKPATGTYMDTISFEIILNKGEVLAKEPNDSALVSTVKDGNTTVLTYVFVLDGEDKAIVYEVERVAPMIYRIFNGALFTGGLLPEVIEGVNFERWSTPLYDSLSFAVFSLVEDEASLLWLWILLAVLAFILIVAVIYILALKGKIIKGVSRVAIAIVEGFFSFCILLAKLGLKIAKKFGKSDDPEDYGFTKEDEPKSEEEKSESSEEDAKEEKAENAEEADKAESKEAESDEADSDEEKDQ